MVYSEEERRQRHNAAQRRWRSRNMDYSAKYLERYRQTAAGLEKLRIQKWLQRGLVCEDVASLYSFYLNCKECEWCGIDLTEDKLRKKSTKCLDHDHTTGLFRNVLCHSCNVRRR